MAKKRILSTIALLAIVFATCVNSISVFANEITEEKTSAKNVYETTYRGYWRSNVPFYSDIDRVIYASSSHSPLNITVKNNSSSLRLTVRMYDPNYSNIDPLWSDYTEGGLAPGQSRTYYVGSNITRVSVRGMTGPGIFSYYY